MISILFGLIIAAILAFVWHRYLVAQRRKREIEEYVSPYDLEYWLIPMQKEEAFFRQQELNVQFEQENAKREQARQAVQAMQHPTLQEAFEKGYIKVAPVKRRFKTHVLKKWNPPSEGKK